MIRVVHFGNQTVIIVKGLLHRSQNSDYLEKTECTAWKTRTFEGVGSHLFYGHLSYGDSLSCSLEGIQWGVLFCVLFISQCEGETQWPWDGNNLKRITKAKVNTFWRNPPSIQISKNSQCTKSHRLGTREKFTAHPKEVIIRESQQGESSESDLQTVDTGVNTHRIGSPQIPDKTD